MNLSHDHLISALDYDPLTGVFTWKKPASNRVRAGDKAGSLTSYGYLSIRINGVAHQAHRLAWMWMTSGLPLHEIDHIDGDRINNAWKNLRDVPRCVNAQNLRAAKKTSSTGVLGVVHHGDRWIARITAARKDIYLGIFDTPGEAQAAYLSAKRHLHQGCTL